ncbi:MAG: [FeFe] hydrogenase H-cluster radical SAM maturase HydG, partial [Bacteroidales bacterium]
MPESYRIKDIPGIPFIDPGEIEQYLHHTRPDTKKVEDIVEKAVDKNRLSLEDVACLINADEPE